ncbi:connector enhancer of kinase suppressor of ras 2-like [Equus przewalskii]|uniref:Connector enhancer of kinase suppressor of ras 2-like n=1 Tax=Equus przewalskii TaxID=9798 RepID=A0ABM4N799_EQUPR
MNYWVGQMLQLAYGSSFGDEAANEEYRRIGAMIYANCVLALTRDFPVIRCNTCHHPTTIVSASPAFQYRCAQDVSDEFIYFRPIDAEVREEPRRQKQQKQTLASHQHTREEHSHPRTPRNPWLESPENAESPRDDDLEVAKSMYPFGERPIFRHSWEELLEAPLNSEGLHILQTTPTKEKEIGYLRLPPEEKNQATTSHRGCHLDALQGPFPLLPQHPKLQRQRSHSLPRYRSRKLNVPELTLNPEETRFFFPSDHNLLTRETAKDGDSIEEAWQEAILSASGEHPPFNPSFENSSAMRGKIGIPVDNTRLPRGNVKFPRNSVIIPVGNDGVPMGNVGLFMDNAGIPMDNAGIPMDNLGVLRGRGGVPMGNLEVPRGNGGVPRGSGVGISMGNVETLRNNVGTSRRIISSPLTELSKIGEHRL